MKILALVADAYGGLGGIAQANRDLFEALAQNGHEVVVLPRSSSQEAVVGIPKNIRQKKPSLNRVIYALRAIRIMTEEKYNLIFCGHLFMAPLAWILSKVFHLPYWIHTHGIEAWEEPPFLIRKAAEESALVTAVSRYTRRRYLSWSNIVPEKARVLPNTFSERFALGPKPDYLIDRYGLKGKKVILTVGRLSSKEKYKGHDRVIAALPKVLEKYPEIIYIIVGDGDDRKRLEAFAKKNNVEEKVLFIGQVTADELPNVYRMSDVFVMPSTGEGFGIAFLEAAASGLLAIGLNQDGSVDALREGRLGLLLEEDNSEQLSRMIGRVFNKELQTNKEVDCFSKKEFKQHVKNLIRHVMEPSLKNDSDHLECRKINL